MTYDKTYEVHYVEYHTRHQPARCAELLRHVRQKKSERHISGRLVVSTKSKDQMSGSLVLASFCDRRFRHH